MTVPELILCQGAHQKGQPEAGWCRHVPALGTWKREDTYFETQNVPDELLLMLLGILIQMNLSYVICGSPTFYLGNSGRLHNHPAKKVASVFHYYHECPVYQQIQRHYKYHICGILSLYGYRNLHIFWMENDGNVRPRSRLPWVPSGSCTKTWCRKASRGGRMEIAWKRDIERWGWWWWWWWWWGWWWWWWWWWWCTYKWR